MEYSFSYLHSEEHKPPAWVMVHMNGTQRDLVYNSETFPHNAQFSIQFSFNHIALLEEHGRQCIAQESSRKAYASYAPWTPW